MVIKKPIFIVGSGRSGTTVFYNFLSTHPEVSWFSNYSDRFVNVNLMPFLHRIFDLTFVGTIAKKGIISKRKLYIKPTEADNIYHDYCGFKHSIKTTENDLNVGVEKKFKDLIKRHLLLNSKERFLSKQTANNQRIRLIDKMFNDAYYIHVIRDGRAVANSLINVRWWNDIDVWWLGEKASEWEKKGRQPIELCGLHWKRDVEEILENKSLFEDRYIEVRYEEFILDVRGTMEKVTNFCGLSNSKYFSKMLPQTLPNMNYKWKDDLKEEQKTILDKTLKPFLVQLGYD
jgi:Sulfotransferase family